MHAGRTDTLGASSYFGIAPLVNLFTMVALVIVAVGIYGVMSYQVARRKQEIVIRLVLGAARRRLLTVIALNGLRLSVIGVAIGCAGALALSRVLGALLFDVQPTDLASFIGAGVGLAIIALVGSALPARRATQLDPAGVLRSSEPADG